MRIISGKNKGRKIVAPANLPVRPTTDFAKESLFNILNNHVDFDELDVLDLFAGTGNISYEFCSRGSKSVTAIDIDKKCARFIQQTAQKLDFKNLFIIQSDYRVFLNRTVKKWDLIFADPPYNMEKIENISHMIFENQLLRKNGILIIEHSQSIDFSAFEGFVEQRVYGKVNFSFFKSNQ